MVLKIKFRFENGRFDQGVDEALYQIYKIKNRGGCTHISWAKYQDWLYSLMKNSNMPRYGLNDNFLRLEILSYVSENKLNQAVFVFSKRDENTMSVSLLKMKVELLLMAGQDEEVLALIGRLKEKHDRKTKSWAVNEKYFLDAEKAIRLK